MRRVLRPGGTAALYVWDYAGEMQLMRRFWDAAVALDPEAEALDEGRRFPICSPGALRDLLRNAGLIGIEVRTTDVPTIRSEEHTSELQSLMRISYAVFCLKKKTKATSLHHIKINSHQYIYNLQT